MRRREVGYGLPPPLGATTTESKIAETESALRVGAQEIDMVINVGALRSGDLETVKQDIKGVVVAAHRAGAIVKVILETALLDDIRRRLRARWLNLPGRISSRRRPASGRAARRRMTSH